MIQWIKNLFRSKSGGSQLKRPLTDEQFNEQRLKRQQKFDQILDKISKHGVESLSQSEKNFLKNFNNS
jgi:hypothetical protein